MRTALAVPLSWNPLPARSPLAGKLMRALTTALLVLLTACGSSAPSLADEAEPKVIYLVRHAEKEPGGTASDPALTREGQERAKGLARIVSDVDLRAVYSTDYVRTRETALPATARRDLKLTIYDPTRLEELAEELLDLESGSYLVVGHSNTTPALVELLGGEPGPPIAEPTEYDRLYLLFVDSSGEVTTQLLRFGN